MTRPLYIFDLDGTLSNADHRKHLLADTDMQAHDRLQGAIDKAWATISPHPAPRLLDVIPGALVLERMTAESIAEERREYG